MPLCLTATHRALLSIDVNASFAIGASDSVVDARALDCEDITKVGGGLCATLRAGTLRTLPSVSVMHKAKSLS